MLQNRIRKKQLDYTWPGFVDALSSLLMVIIFVLMIFVISQFFISQKMSGQDEALIKLKNNLTELSELLSLERGTTSELTTQLSVLEEKLAEWPLKCPNDGKIHPISKWDPRSKV